MKKPAKIRRLMIVGVLVGLLAVPITASPSYAVSCGSGETCYWDNGSLSGGPTGTIYGSSTSPYSVDVTDNMISSGRSNNPNVIYVPSGLPMWHKGTNVVNPFWSVVVADFPYATNVYLGGASANNVIDDMYWG